MGRTFVVGLDGASWQLASPWIDNGDLPHLNQIRKEGSWATSRSCLPPVTFPNWKCYSSGKNPGKFGVYWFERIDIENERIDVMNGQDFETAELWDYLNKAGLTAGVINMPTMYPPRSIDGPIVCGGPDAVDGEYRSISSGYTSPAELEDQLVQEYNYQVHPEPLISSNQERGEEVDVILELLEKRFQVSHDLFIEQRLDFVHVTLFYLNVLHHFFWDETPVKRAWKIVDEWLGKLLELEETNLIVMSDHGAAPTTTEFYINEWLAENGYLTKQRSVDWYLRQLGLTRETALSIAKRAGIVNILTELVPDEIQKLVPQSAGVKRQRKLEQIIVGKTQALASGQGPVYINPSFDDGTTRDQLIADLESVSDDTGKPLFAGVHKAEKIYEGSYIDIGPDIIIDQRPGVHINDGIGKGSVQTKPDRWAAENTPTGIFAAVGPDFKSKGKINEISILDIAPTILASQGVDVPTDMDGEVLPILLDSTSYDSQSPINLDIDRSTDRNDDVADRLKQLGYME